MFSFGFEITNPFKNSHVWKDIKEHEHIFHKYNKSIEFSTAKKPSCLLHFQIYLTSRCNYAGLETEFGLLGYFFWLQFNDTRQWDEKAKQYKSINKR